MSPLSARHVCGAPPVVWVAVAHLILLLLAVLTDARGAPQEGVVEVALSFRGTATALAVLEPSVTSMPAVVPPIYTVRVNASQLDAPRIADCPDVLGTLNSSGNASDTEVAAGMRRWVVVSVPPTLAGVACAARTERALLELAAAAQVTLVDVMESLCHCPVITDASASVFRSETALWFGRPFNATRGSNGSAVQYFYFADSPSNLPVPALASPSTSSSWMAAAAPVYEVLDPITEAHRFYVMDAMPGDTTTSFFYTGVRRLSTVSAAANISSVSDVTSLQLFVSTSNQFLHVGVSTVSIGATLINGVHTPPNVEQSLAESQSVAYAAVNQSVCGLSSCSAALRSVASASVDVTQFNLSRLATGVLQRSQTRVVSNPLVWVEGQSRPIVDVLPGEPRYSDVWQVVFVPREWLNTTDPSVVFTSLDDVLAAAVNRRSDSDALDDGFTGEFIDFVVVNTTWSATNDTPSLSQPVVGELLPVWCRGATAIGLVLEATLPNGCVIDGAGGTNRSAALRLQRINETAHLAAADVFLTPPPEWDDVRYTPFVTVGTALVAATYSAGDAVPASVMAPGSFTDERETIPNGGFRNAARRVRQLGSTPAESPTAITSTASVNFATQEVDGSVSWLVRGAAVLNQTTAPSPPARLDIVVDVARAGMTSPHDAVLVGFGGAVPRDGVFLMLFVDASGTQCLRQFRGNLSRPGEALDVTAANPLRIASEPRLYRSFFNSTRSRWALRVSLNVTASSQSSLNLFRSNGSTMYTTVWIARGAHTRAAANCSVPFATVLLPQGTTMSSASTRAADFLSSAWSAPVSWLSASGVDQGSSLVRYANARGPVFSSLGAPLAVVAAPPAQNPNLVALLNSSSPYAIPNASDAAGSFRCDSSLTIRWAIDASTRIIRFSVTLASPLTSMGGGAANNASGVWFSLSLGNPGFSGTDRVVVYRNPFSVAQELVARDQRCFVVAGTSVCGNDPAQDVTAVSVSADGSTWEFTRPVRTFDNHSQIAALSTITSLSPSAVVSPAIAFGGSGTAVTAWRVLTVSFSNSPQFILQDGAVGLATLYRLRNESAPSSAVPYTFLAAQMELQPQWRFSLIDVAPGLDGYSDLWSIVDVFVPSHYRGVAIRSVGDIPHEWRQAATRLTVNCPVLHASAKVSTTAATPHRVFFRDIEMQCAAFAANQSMPNVTQRVYLVQDANDNTTRDVVFEHAPTTNMSTTVTGGGDTNQSTLAVVNPLYSPFVHEYSVRVPSTYVPGTLTTVRSIADSGYPVIDLNRYSNRPIVAVLSAVVPGSASPTPPSGVDASYLAPYSMQQVLYNDETQGEKVLLLWNYLEVAQVLQVRVIAYGITGYVALGFSSEDAVQMTDSDIVLGYIHAATLMPCNRTLYSVFPTSAPSATPTLQIFDVEVERVSNALILTFSREFDGGAHAAGVIPARSKVSGLAQSRVVYATLRGILSADCGTQAFAPLYHGTAPHGSAVVSWTPALTPAPSTPQPPATPSPSPPNVANLSPQTITAEQVFHRGVLEYMVCIPQPSGTSLAITPTLRSASTTATTAPDMFPFGAPEFPKMFRFVDASGDIRSDMLPLISEFPSPVVGASNYSGAWQVAYVNASGQTANITKLAALSGLSYTVSSDYVACVVVHSATTISIPANKSSVPAWTVFYEGQSVTCLLLSPARGVAAAALQLFPLWNVTNSTTGAATQTPSRVIDDASGIFFATLRAANNNKPGTVYASADSGVASLRTTRTGTAHCVVLTPLERSSASAAPPSPKYISGSGGVLGAPTTIALQSGVVDRRAVQFYMIPSLPRARCGNRQSNWGASGAVLGTLYLIRNSSASSNGTTTVSWNSLLLGTAGYNATRMTVLTTANVTVGQRNVTLNATATQNATVVTVDVIEELVVSSTEMDAVIDSLPGINVSYCDGVWRVAVADLALIPQLVSNGALSAPPEINQTLLQDKNFSYLSGAFLRAEHTVSPTYVPWWATLSVLKRIANETERVSGQRTDSAAASDRWLHCPVVHPGTTVAPSSSTLDVLTVWGLNVVVKCVHLGVVHNGSLASYIPALVNVTSTSSSSNGNGGGGGSGWVFEATPGSVRYTGSIAWVVKMTTPLSLSSISSFSAFNATAASVEYQLAYIAVVAVGPLPPRNNVTRTLVARNNTVSWNIRTGVATQTVAAAHPLDSVAFTASAAAWQVRRRSFPYSLLDLVPATANEGDAGADEFQNLNPLYVFRRAASLSSPLVVLSGGGTNGSATQRPIADYAPWNSSFHRSNGTYGYTDIKRVIIVVVPYSNATGYTAEVTSVTAIPLSWQRVETAVMSHHFLGATLALQRTSDGAALTCPTTTTWVGAVLYTGLECGLSSSSSSLASSTVNVPIVDAVDGSRWPFLPTTPLPARVGPEALVSLVPLALSNYALFMPFALKDTASFRVDNLDATETSAGQLDELQACSTRRFQPTVRALRYVAVESTLSAALWFVVAGSSSSSRSSSSRLAAFRKYVFRSGPTISSSLHLANPIMTLPVADGSGSGFVPVVSRLHVVNVGDYTAEELSLFSLETEAHVLALARRNCWPIVDTALYEPGVLLHVQANVSSATLDAFQQLRSPGYRLAVETVVVDGVPRKHVVSERLFSASVADEWAASLAANRTAPFLGATLQGAGLNKTQEWSQLVRAADGSTILSANSGPTNVPLVEQHTCATCASFSSTLVSHWLPGLSSSENLVNSAVSGWSLLLIVSEELNPYVTPLTPTQLQRSTVWYQGRTVAAYAFEDRNVRYPYAPAPLFIFRRLTASGGVQGSLGGSPLIDALPGHDSYHDIHQLYFCDVPAAAQSVVTTAPTTVAQMLQWINAGLMLPPVPSGVFRMTPIVHSSSRIEARDMIGNGGTVLGPFTVFYEAAAYVYFDFGVATNGFRSTDSLAVKLVWSLGLTPLPDGVVISTIPSDNATVFSFVRRVVTAVLPNIVLPRTVTDVDSALRLAEYVRKDVCNHSYAVVQVASLPDTSALDDYDVSFDAATAIQWSYGPVVSDVSSGIVSFSPASRSGTGTISFFTGNVSGDTPQSADWTNVTNTTTVRLGSAVELSWTIGSRSGVGGTGGSTAAVVTSATTLSTQRRMFDALDGVATYAPNELYVQLRFVVTEDVWIGFGITDSDAMAGADMWIAYASRTLPVGSVTSSYYYELSDRHADPVDSHAMPVHDAQNNLELVSLTFTAAGYTVVYQRRLATGDTLHDRDIVDATQTFLWAYGPYNLNGQTPMAHTNRGLVTANLYRGQNVLVPQQGFSYWYIALLVALGVFTLAAALLSRILPPGFLMFKRPLLFYSLPDSAWRRATVSELWILAALLGVGIAWGYGCYRDFVVSRRTSAIAMSIGSSAAYLLYFAFLPTLRHNIVVTAFFRASWHKTQHWTTLLLALATVLAWIHGGMMIAQQPQKSVKTAAGLCGLIGTVMLTLVFLLFAGGSRWQRNLKRLIGSDRWTPRRNFVVRNVLQLAMIVLLCVHLPRLAIGWVPWFAGLLFDGVLRWRDFRTRTGNIRAAGSFGSDVVGIELAVYSPWSNWFARPLLAAPGQFIMVDVLGVTNNGQIPLTISSRVLQDPKADVASLTVHVKAASPVVGATRTLRQLADQQRLRGAPVRVEGPYGGLSLRLKWYRSLIMIGAGTGGVASVVSLLETLVFQPDYFAMHTSLESLTVVCVNRREEDHEVFATELLEILKAPRPFDLQLLLYVTGTPPTRPFHSAVEIASSHRSQLPPTAVRPRNHTEDAAAESHPLFQHVKLIPGRPSWSQLLSAEQSRAAARGEVRVALHVNGPRLLVTEVLQLASLLSPVCGGVALHADYEEYTTTGW